MAVTERQRPPGYARRVTPRFILLTFVSCVLLFAAIWAATAPKVPVAAPVADAAPAALYADCDAVRAANAAPLRASQPGYRPALDPNMNGIACEPVGGAAALDMTSAPDMSSAPADSAPTFASSTQQSAPPAEAPPTPPDPNPETPQIEM